MVVLNAKVPLKKNQNYIVFARVSQSLLKTLHITTADLRKSSGMLRRIIRGFSMKHNESIFNDKQSNMTLLGMFIPEDRFRNIPTFHLE